MRVAFIAAECEPWAKTGGLGDVVDALARALGRIDEPTEPPVDVYLPRYRAMRLPDGQHPRRRLRVPDPVSPIGSTEVTIVDVVSHGYRLRLVDYPPAFDRAGYYGDPTTGDYPDNAWRFGLLSRAAIEMIRTDGRPIDVLHLHDWHAAPAVLLRDRFYAADPIVGRAATLQTIHNLAYHGWVPRDRLSELGLAAGDPVVPVGADGLDLLRAAIERSELVNTVSPGYAAEGLTPEHGMGLDPVLRAKAAQQTAEGSPRFFGILNGLDTELWDPATDLDLAKRYTAADRSGKVACRADLLARHGMDPDDPGPVLGMIGRLDPQKGFDLLADAAPDLVAAGARIIVQGSGDPRLADPFRALAIAHPSAVALVERFDRENARRIYAGSDLFLMPSRFEPCGQGQMIALRYGTPPLVRRTGGLGDTVIDMDERPGEGTGFVFDEPTPAALLVACRRAFARRGRSGSTPDWAGMVARGMAIDFDWETGSAPRYVDAYRRALELRRGEVAPVPGRSAVRPGG